MIDQEPYKRPLISACVMTLNEEANIERCLGSLTWCDEILVVDSGSTESVSSTQYNTLISYFVLVCDFSNGCGFSNTVDTYDQSDMRHVVFREVKIL